MAEFNKKNYIRSGLWMDDDYLVQPETAVKRCRCCGKLFYTADFINIPEIVDGKMPVCIWCYRSRKLSDTVQGIMDGRAEVRMCRKCEMEKPISQFTSYDGRYNKMKDTCQDCTPTPSHWREDGDED